MVQFYIWKMMERICRAGEKVASVASGVCTSANQVSCCDTLVRSEQRRPKKNFIRAAWNRREADTMRLFTHCRFLFWPRATPLLPSLGSQAAFCSTSFCSRPLPIMYFGTIHQDLAAYPMTNRPLFHDAPGPSMLHHRHCCF